MFYSFKPLVQIGQAGYKMFYSFTPIQTGSTGLGRMQDVLLIQITGPNWFRQGARCFLLIQTYSHWFKLVQAGCKMFYTHSNLFRLDARCLIIQTYLNRF
jgi:hypothetical protein